MKYLFEKFKKKWSKAFSSKCFLIEFLISIIVLIFVMMFFSKFSEVVELRKGIQFKDPLLELYVGVDLTRPIFTMIYGGIISALIILLFFPYRLMILFEAYALMVTTRIVMMFIMPLAPPMGIVLLKDPFVELFGTGKTLVNDLFFSGHTASIFLLYLAVPKKFKWIFLLLTILVAVSVLLQKVHYTIDVIIAPYVSFVSYYLIKSFFRYRYKTVRSVSTKPSIDLEGPLVSLLYTEKPRQIQVNLKQHR